MNAVSVGKAFSMHTTGRTLTHTRYPSSFISTAFHRRCVNRNYSRSFHRDISSSKARGRRNVSGIPTKGASSSTSKCSSQHKGSYVASAHFIADVRSVMDTAYPWWRV
ncbi:hypothetical protein TNCV_4937821 [Trichonephila clavipes]|nr:hypothetical protein TNCV_4937821 [Trichonephila clavipes]